MSSALTGRGRCLCGDVTFECSAEPLWSLYCHCKSCRLNTGSPATAFFGMANGYWRWTGREPERFVSAPGVYRHFCSKCGTPMAYSADRFPGEIHFYTSALEDDQNFRPTGHVHASERLSWFDIADDLPHWAGTMGKNRIR